MRIAYITQCFPSTTVTFIRREIESLVAVEEEVSVFSIRKPGNEAGRTSADFLACDVLYLEDAGLVNLISAHLYYAAVKPLVYFSLLYSVFFGFKLFENGARWRLVKLFLLSAWASRTIKRNKIDHMHCYFTANASTMGYLIEKFENVPFSISAHNIFLTDTLLLQKKLHASKFVTVISLYAKDYLLSRYPDCEGLKDKIHLIRCGVMGSYVRRSERPIRLSDGGVKIICVGQLAERKGQRILIEAVKLLSAKGVDVDCKIIGDGDQKGRLCEQINRDGLDDYVSLMGSLTQKEIESLLDTVDLFVLPCIRTNDGDEDGIPVALMEAMAKGLPCISSPVAGIPELICDGVNGCLVKEGSSELFAEAIVRISNDAEMLARISNNAIKTIIDEYTVERNVEILKAILLEAHSKDTFKKAVKEQFYIEPIVSLVGMERKAAVVQWGGLNASHRSEFLSKIFGMDHIAISGTGGIFSPFFLPRLIKAIFFLGGQLRRLAPDIVVVQQPPFYAAFFVKYYLRRNAKAKVYIDCHSGVLLDNKWAWSWPLIQKYSAMFDGAIFTNEEMASKSGSLYCDKLVLPDPPIKFYGLEKTKFKSRSAMIVCSSSEDEDDQWIINIASVYPEILFYVTCGTRWKRLNERYRRRLADNVIGLEYMSNQAYYHLMNSVDFVVCMTNREYTLLSGAFEALWLEKPILTTGTKTLRNFYGKTAVYADVALDHVAVAIDEMLVNIDRKSEEAADVRAFMIRRWIEQSKPFVEQICADGGAFNETAVIEYKDSDVWPRDVNS